MTWIGWALFFPLLLLFIGLCIHLRKAMRALSHYQHCPIRILDMAPNGEAGQAHLRLIIEHPKVWSRDVKISLTSAQYIAGAPFYRELVSQVIASLEEYRKIVLNDH